MHVRVESGETPWTTGLEPGTVLRLPIAHGDGRYFADPDTLARIEANGQVIFRYADADGHIGPGTNPNGSLNDIAGVSNERGNVVGLMPHPERAYDRMIGGDDGLRILSAVLEAGISAATRRIS